MTATGSQLLVKALCSQRVDTIFGYPGGAIMSVYDALIDAPLRHILVRHEQAAVLAASGYARASGKVGVCLATSGPGATNLVTGLADARLDSVPIVAITGQVATPFMGTDAFQEVDMIGLTLPIVKHSFLPRSTTELAAMIPEAFRIAREGRPGPVVIDLPKDVAAASVPLALRSLRGVAEAPPPAPTAASIAAAVTLYSQSRRPLVYAGGGVGMADAVEEFRSFIAEAQLPVVTTLKGIGVIPTQDPLCLGMLGMHGTKAANYAVQSCDLLITVGARFDDRATGKLQTFAPHAKVIHMDVDPAEVSKLRRADCILLGDLRAGMAALQFPLPVAEWRTECLRNRMLHTWTYDAPGDGVYAPRLLKRLFARLSREAIVACDVGQHQMWVAQHGQFDHPSRHLSSGGLGTMGYGLPAAIGAQLAYPNAPVVCVSGDGSIMMNLQELATINRYHLPVKILLFDNHRLGLVRQWQELFFAGRFSAVELDDNPDFALVARSFGIPALRIEGRGQESAAVTALVETPGPLLVHVLIDPSENVWPLVPPGKSNAEMMEALP